MEDPQRDRPVSKHSDAVEVLSGPIADIAAEYGEEGTTTLLPPRPKEVMPKSESGWMRAVETMLNPKFWKDRPYLMAPILIAIIIALVSVTASGNTPEPPRFPGQKVVVGSQVGSMINARPRLPAPPRGLWCDIPVHMTNSMVWQGRAPPSTP